MEVSVVVATRDRPERLRRLLAALAAQLDPPPFEVVVVDDASAQPVPDPPLPSGLDLTILRQPRRLGPAAARNRGWQAARAPIVAFTDDDCRPDPGWLRALVAPVVDGDADIAQGRTVPDPEERANRGPFGRTMHVPFEQGFYETCNIAYRRALLADLGGFDESFRHPYGEDTDLAWRAREAGARTAFVPDATVYHAVWPSDYRSHLRDMPRREGLVLLYRKHPRLRRHFGRRVFFREAHAPALAAVAAVAAVALRPRSPAARAGAAGAGLWYAWVCHLVRPNPPRRWQWAGVVPLALAADAYEVAVLAAASVRYRTLLL